MLYRCNQFCRDCRFPSRAPCEECECTASQSVSQSVSQWTERDWQRHTVVSPLTQQTSDTRARPSSGLTSPLVDGRKQESWLIAETRGENPVSVLEYSRGPTSLTSSIRLGLRTFSLTRSHQSSHSSGVRSLCGAADSESFCEGELTGVIRAPQPGQSTLGQHWHTVTTAARILSFIPSDTTRPSDHILSM